MSISTASDNGERWPLVPLRDLCILRTGVRNTRELLDDEFRYVDITAVDNVSKRITGPQTLKGRDAPSRARNIIRTRDVIVSTTRPNLNAVAIVPDDLDDQICSTGFCVLRAGPRICPEYLFGFVRSPTFIEPLSDLVKGALYPAVNDAQVLALEIPLPPLAEQERIATRLTEQLATVERARVAALTRLAAAEALPAAYLRVVFEGPEANKWVRVPIGRLGNPGRGEAVQTGPFGAQLPSSEFKREGVPVLNIGNVKDGQLELRKLDYVTPAKAADLERYRLRPGDMLFTRSGSVGRSAVVTDQCDGWLMSYHLLRVAFDLSLVDPGFISAAVRGDPFVLQQVRSAAGRGATRDGVNATILSELVVPLPELVEQQRVLADLQRRLTEADHLTAIIRDELAAIEALPAALLRDAFNGND